ncbi:MAG: 3-deoxy-7-phosphoheptulonate synthase, partial [Candidatus Binataceae bacterium]
YRRQPAVLEELVGQISGGSRAIMGVMLESNLEAGNQSLAGGRASLKYGGSVTDPCIDWPTTERHLRAAAANLAHSSAPAAAAASS